MGLGLVTNPGGGGALLARRVETACGRRVYTPPCEKLEEVGGKVGDSREDEEMIKEKAMDGLWSRVRGEFK